MKAVAVTYGCVVALFFAGCAGKTSADGETADDITAARPPVTLPSTEDGSSVQAKLFQILRSFQSDPELKIFAPADSNLLVLQGGHEPRVAIRSIGCHETSRIDPKALAPIFAHECTLTGFEAVRGNASLPPVTTTTASGSEPPLASKLFSLLAKAEQKGGFGVRRGGFKAACCDQPSSTVFTLADARSSLSCTSTSGGFISISSVSCLYQQQDAIPVEVLKGTLVTSVGIGGENTGFSARVDGKAMELVLQGADRAKFVSGRVARITGLPTTLSGVETSNRPAVDVSNLLVCPAPNGPLDPKVTVDDDRSWLTTNCPGLGPLAH